MSNMKHERGVVSLIVTMIMMIVITLLVLGFAQIARNEQRSSLDDQLSAQAYYAAESGINDARAVINQLLSSSGPAAVTSKLDCNTSESPYLLQPNVDSTHNVAYTCVMINAAPPSLTYTAGYNSTVVPLTAGNGSFNTLTLTWFVPSGLPSTSSGCDATSGSIHTNPIAAGAGTGEWTCDYPMMRVDLVDPSGGLSRANWAGDTSTMFFVPVQSTSGPANSVALGAKGTAVPASCSNISCIANITGLSGTTYYMRVTTMYHDNSTLIITAANNNTFVGAQATVDCTGRAQDVLRRVLVAVDLTDANSYHVPSAALVTRDSICKRFSVTPGSFQVYSDITINGVEGNPYCTVQSIGSPTP